MSFDELECSKCGKYIKDCSCLAAHIGHPLAYDNTMYEIADLARAIYIRSIVSEFHEDKKGIRTGLATFETSFERARGFIEYKNKFLKEYGK